MSDKWKSVPLSLDIDHEKVQAVFDDNQFVWVDGRENSHAKRVRINTLGEIDVATIGVPRPLYKPSVVGVGFSNRNDEGTHIKRGKVFLICYTYVNDRGEEGNPSPITVVDNLQHYSKGYYEKGGEQYYYPITGGTYHYDSNITGSITDIDIKVNIDTDDIRRVNIYLAEADYVETVIPPTQLRLITSKIVPRKTQITDIVIAMPASAIIASYENDRSPKGDAITIASGTTFIGNSVNDIGLPHEVDGIWKITLSNFNKYNYTNRWFRIDLFAEGLKDYITQDVLEGIRQWSEEDKSLYRMLDSDMTTPLELFYYPTGEGDGYKIHKKIEIETTGAKAYTELYLPEPDKYYRVEARFIGADGDNYNIELLRGTLQADILIDEASGDTIIVRAMKEIGNVWIKLTDPETASALKIDVKEDEPKEYKIEIVLAHNGDEVTSTAYDVINLIEAEIMGALVGIIDSVDTSSYDEFDEHRIVEGMEEYQPFMCDTTAEINGYDIKVLLGYNVETAAITAKMYDVYNAVNNTEGVREAIRFVTTESLEEDAIEMPQQYFSGGISGSIAGDSISTCMLSWIRIPQVPAHQDKSIYLVKFKEKPDKIENPFTKLIVSGASGNNVISLANFYKNKFVRNPIPNEETFVASGYNMADIIKIDSGEREGYLKKNAANMLAPTSGAQNDVFRQVDTITRYDERAGSVSGGAVLINHNASSVDSNIGGREFMCEVNLSEKGYMWASSIIPADFGWFEICSLRAHQNYRNLVCIMARKYQGEYYLHLVINDSSHESSWVPLYPNFNVLPGDRVHAVVSWDGDRIHGDSSGLDGEPVIAINIGILANGVFKSYKHFERNVIDVTKKMMYADKPTRPLMFGLRTGVALKDDWQLLSVLRTMPLFPTESIGALDKFEALIDGGEPQAIIYINNNVSFERMSIAADTLPGRIQWGAYGAMPDLNEYNIHEDIMGLYPIKSFQPTDEHNTVLVFTRDNTYILALLGDSANSCSLIKQLNGIGLTKRGVLCGTQTGVAWLSQQGIMHLTAEGTENLTKGKINTDGTDNIIYDKVRNWLWARGDNNTYVYQLYEKLWWRYEGDAYPDDFIGSIDEQYGWISYADKVAYMEGDAPHTEEYKTHIKTKAFPLVRKLGRVKLIGKLSDGNYKLKANLFSNRMDEQPQTTSQYPAKMNGRIAIPGLASDYVQLELEEVDNAIALELEYEDGVK